MFEHIVLCSEAVQSLTDFANILPEHCLGIPSSGVSSFDLQIEAIETAWSNVQAVLTHTLTQLRLEHNKAIRASSLPPELLRIIYRDLRMDYKTLVRLTHTCSHWRTVLLQDRSAWTHIDLASFPSEELADLFAERSGPLPLNVVYSAGFSISWCSRFCEREVHRIQKLHWWLTEDIWLEISDTLLDFSWMANNHAPELVELCMVPTTKQTAGDHVVSRVFSQGTPKLHSLALLAIRLPWAPGHYQGLTTLYVNLCVMPSPRINPLDVSILWVFRDSPHLEDLFLHIPYNTRAVSDYTSASDGPLLPLPRLKRAILELTSQDMFYILSSTSLSHEQLQLHLGILGSASEDIMHCLPTNPQWGRCSNLTVTPGSPYISMTSPSSTGFIELNLGDLLVPASFSSAVECWRRLGCCVPFDFVTIDGLGYADADEETQALAELATAELHANNLCIKRCSPSVIGGLNKMLAERTLNILQFREMGIEVSSLLHFSIATRRQIKTLSVTECILLTDEEDIARRKLSSIRALFEETDFVDISFLTPSMTESLPLTDSSWVSNHDSDDMNRTLKHDQ